MKTLKNILLCLLIGVPSATHAQEGYWQQSLRYRIAVRLDDASHTLDGQISIRYKNNSPDTLRFIWFHIWPNAYKNDRTAFSEQLLENGRTDFYFSDASERGFINRLDFRVDGSQARVEDHPVHQDIIRLILPAPLLPGGETEISTPFHVQLPRTFSRGGHDGQTYQITQWYPKPAVYDRDGWHPMPYTDQGEFFSEFGTYRVEISVPAAYAVAATGELRNADELQWLRERGRAAPAGSIPEHNPDQKNPAANAAGKDRHQTAAPLSTESADSAFKTLVFEEDNIHDFAFFADRDFVVSLDSVTLPSGRVVQTRIFHRPDKKGTWTRGQQFLKNALLYHGGIAGEYPYGTVSVVEGRQGFAGGMEYPGITILDAVDDEETLEELIVHEVGHNWYQGMLGSNERAYPWMDEGLNTYFDDRYRQIRSGVVQGDPAMMLFNTFAALRRDQPMNTPSEKMYKLNYAAVTYAKAGAWFCLLEKELGQPLFDSCVRTYFRDWQFRHPGPADLRRSFETASGRDMGEWFSMLGKTGPLQPDGKRTLRWKPFITLKDTDRYDHIFYSPIPGSNAYDGFMAGLLLHNHTLPPRPLRFAASAMYGFRSKTINGIGQVSHTWYPKGAFQQVSVTIDAARFTMNEHTGEYGTVHRSGYRKISPSVRVEWKEKEARVTRMRFMEYRSFHIGEDALLFRIDTSGTVPAVQIDPYKTRYTIHQFRYVWDQYRVLYPWRAEARLEAGPGYGRLAITGDQFYNYKNKGGIAVRVFAGKFIYAGGKTITKASQTDRYHLNLTGPNGREDYTYQNYFAGRNEYEGIASQQIMMRDGGFKVRTDRLSNKVGKSDDWLLAVNATIDVPDRLNILHLLPVKIPLRIFADIGTHAGAWKSDEGEPRLLFDAGLQLSLLRSTFNIYIPLWYGKVYRDYFRSVPDNGFLQRISFSIDIHRFRLRQWVHEKMN